MQIRRLVVLLLLVAAPAFGQTTHSVKITWTDTTNPVGTTYGIYRASAPCSTNPTLTKLNTAPITTMSYTDANVAAGTYCYAGTAINAQGDESAKSNQAPATIAAPPNAITIIVTVQ
jgi:hypothetical protein